MLKVLKSIRRSSVYIHGFIPQMPLYEKGEVVVIAGGTGVSPVRGVISALAGTEEPRDKHVIVASRVPTICSSGTI